MLIRLLYIDPGTGSLLYQAILSGLLTVSIFFGRIKTLFLARKKKPLDVEQDN